MFKCLIILLLQLCGCHVCGSHIVAYLWNNPPPSLRHELSYERFKTLKILYTVQRFFLFSMLRLVYVFSYVL